MSSPAETADAARTAAAWGVATVHATGVLDTYYPAPALGSDPGPEPAGLASLVGEDQVRGVRTELVRTVIDLDTAPADTADAYLRLHLLSHRLVQPRSLNLDGIFASLPN